MTYQDFQNYNNNGMITINNDYIITMNNIIPLSLKMFKLLFNENYKNQIEKQFYSLIKNDYKKYPHITYHINTNNTSEELNVNYKNDVKIIDSYYKLIKEKICDYIETEILASGLISYTYPIKDGEDICIHTLKEKYVLNVIKLEYKKCIRPFNKNNVKEITAKYFYECNLLTLFHYMMRNDEPNTIKPIFLTKEEVQQYINKYNEYNKIVIDNNKQQQELKNQIKIITKEIKFNEEEYKKQFYKNMNNE